MAEQRDINVSVILKSGLSLLIAVIFTMAAAGGLYVLRRQPQRPTAIVPPEPRLQTNAPGELQRWRATEDEMLNRYEWIDREKGIVRIPITRAMELVAQQKEVK